VFENEKDDRDKLQRRYLTHTPDGTRASVGTSAAHTGGVLRDLFDRSGAGGRDHSRFVPVEPSPEKPSPEEPSPEEPSAGGDGSSAEEPKDKAPEPACNPDPDMDTVVYPDVEECRKQVWTERRVDVSRMFPERMGQPEQCTFDSVGSGVDYVYCFDCKPERSLTAPPDPITAALERMRARLFPEAVVYAGDLGYSGVRDRIADELEFVGVHVGVQLEDRTRVVAFEPRVIKGRVANQDTDTVLTVLKLWWEDYQRRSGADGARLGADKQFVSVGGACPAVRFRLQTVGV